MDKFKMYLEIQRRKKERKKERSKEDRKRCVVEQFVVMVMMDYTSAV
ncbi:hypothetical protein PP707_00915 [Acetobacter pasteurianus]|nr:hypothetical protein [Acetobacter pasteurianus]